MNAEDIIKESIQKAKDDGLTIVRGPVFIHEGLGDNKKLVAVDCFGAVMYANGHTNFDDVEIINGTTREKKLWIYKLFKILNKDNKWWSRYHYGFHHKKQLTIEIKKEDKLELVPCGVSEKSWKLSESVGSVDHRDFLKSRI